MDCYERDLLREVLQIATHEVAWLYEERARIAVDRPEGLARFEEQVIRAAEAHRDQAAGKYRAHVEEHCCAASAA